MPHPRQSRRKERLLALFDRYGIRPQTRRGQNFLLDRNQVAFVARLGEAGPQDVILEVGPGTGFLSRELAASGATVLGVEVDRRLAELLRGEMADLPNFVLLEADILAGKQKINPAVLERLDALRRARKTETTLKCISNLPYSAGTPFVANLFASALPWSLGVYMLQLEVAKRLTASPGNRDYGSLAVAAALGGKAEIVRHVPPQVFWPRPRVASAIVSVRFFPLSARQAIPWNALRRITIAVFGGKRKHLRNALKSVFPADRLDDALARIAAEPDSRGSNLGPEQFLLLARELDSGADKSA